LETNYRVWNHYPFHGNAYKGKNTEKTKTEEDGGRNFQGTIFF
jgi:hypothetical protein